MAQMKLHEDFPDSDLLYFPIYDIDFSYMAAERAPTIYTATGALNYSWPGAVDRAAFPENMPHVKTAAGNICTNRNIWVETGGVYEREDTDMTGVQVGVKPDDFDTMRWRYYSLTVSGDTPHRFYNAVTTTATWSSSINYYRDDSAPENRMNRIFYAENGLGFGVNNGVYGADVRRYTGLCYYHYGASSTSNFVVPYYWHYNRGGAATIWNFRLGTANAQDALDGMIGGAAAGTTGTANTENMLPCINVFVRFDHDGVTYAGIMICKMSDETENATPVSCFIRALPVEMWGASITENDYPEYNSGDESEQQGGINGTWDYSSGTVPEIPVSVLPSVLVTGSAVKVWSIDAVNISNLAARLYNSASSLWQAWENKLYSPSSAIVALHFLPWIFNGDTTSAESVVSLAGISLDASGGYSAVTAIRQNTQWRESAEYTLSVSRIADNFSDYAPYTKMILHIPFCGTMPINPSAVTGGQIRVKFRCDAITGNVAARITTRDRFGAESVCYALGNCGYSVPIMGKQGGAVGASIVGGLISLAGAATGVGAIGALAGIASGVVRESAESTQQITPTGNASPLLDLALWLEISRSIPSNPAQLQTLKGIPANITTKLDSLRNTGFCRVSEIHLDGIAATKEELAEIERLLKQGVLL